jgi:hypothetical protein
MKRGIRNILKSKIPKNYWPFLRFIDEYIINMAYVNFAIQRYLSKRSFHYSHQFQQSIPSFISNISLEVENSADLSAKFKDIGIKVKSGRHSVYINNIKDVAQINEEISHRYPQPFGLKIVKSREISPDGTVYYTSNKLAPATTWFSMVAVGSILEKIVISNLLHTECVAPRIYDIIKLESKDGGWQYAFVVQHIDGHTVTGVEGERFIAEFRKAMGKFKMKVISIKDHSDLRPPEFRNNIIGDSIQTFYVDIQNFVMFDDAFSKYVLRSVGPLFKHCFYLLPFWLLHSKSHKDIDYYLKINEEFQQFLEKHGVDISEKIIIDLSRDNGFFAINCLHSGAKWVFLLRESPIEKWLNFMMTLLGFSRFQISDSIDTMANNIEKIVPEIVYLSSGNTDQRKDFFSNMHAETVIIESDSDYVNSDDITNIFKKKYTYVDRFQILNDKKIYWNFFKKV